MSTATVLLILATGLLAGFIAGVFTGAAWMRRSTPQQPPQDLRPVARALKDMREQLDEMDKQQAVSASSLAGQVQAIGRTSARLGDRTDQLITALRSPQTRGRWGEIQLERVVELGGMLEHVDFDTQAHMRIDGAEAEHFASSAVRDREQLSFAEWAARVDTILHEYARLLNPSAFVVGGGISGVAEQWVPLLTVDVPVVPAALRNNAGIVGAAMAAHSHVAP